MAAGEFRAGLGAAFVIMLVTSTYGFWRVAVTSEELESHRAYIKARDEKWEPLIGAIERDRVEKWEPMLKTIVTQGEAILRVERAIVENQKTLQALLENRN